MIRVFVVHEPDPQRYAQHASIAERVPGTRFRRGRVFRSPFGGKAHFAEIG